MDNRRALSELKLRSEVFRKKSSEVIRILNDKTWFPYPLNHPEDLRQFIYWLSFKRPKSWKTMDVWIKLYDSCVSLLKQLLNELNNSLKDFTYVDKTNILQSKKAADIFVDPGVELRRVGKFARDNLDQPERHRGQKRDQLVRSLEERELFLDMHSKITHLYDPNLTVSLRQSLTQTADSDRLLLLFDPVAERAKYPSLPIDLNKLMVRRPLRISVEDSEHFEGVLKFADCVIYLCEEIGSEMERLMRESHFRTSGFAERVKGLNYYKMEKALRTGMFRVRDSIRTEEEGDDHKLPPINWNRPKIVTNDIL